MKKYTADFETSTWNDTETWVWAYSIADIEKEEIVETGNCIEDFMIFCEENANCDLYFHNLKFDGIFLISWLLENGFTHIIDKKDKKERTFTTLITNLGVFYSITVYFKVYNKKVKRVTFYDSLKIINMGVDKIPKNFDIELKKLEIDYNKPRKKGHELTQEEVDYVNNDVLIVAKALKIIFFDMELTKMTQGANALADYKKITGEGNYTTLFPEIDYEIYLDLKQSYRGGFTYLNPIYKNKDVENGTVIDVNSLYPSCMLKNLPYGNPKFFEGEYEEDRIYPLYIQMFSCSFKLKENKIPCLQIKNNLSYRTNEYLESSYSNLTGELEEEVLCLSSIDLKLFLEQYHVYNLRFLCGWKFKVTDNLFKKYIDKWIELKYSSKKEGKTGLYTWSKVMLNSLYGKFGKNPKNIEKIPYLNENGIVKFKQGEEEIGKGLYLPVAIFITAYGRDKTIRTSQKIRDYSLNKYGVDKYIYSDTDSIHCLLTDDEIKQFVEVDPFEIGKWDIEEHFEKGRYIRQKTYIHKNGEDLKIKASRNGQKLL